jgi:DNA-directed RNA polymerase specialized sigma24 family protein
MPAGLDVRDSHASIIRGAKPVSASVPAAGQGALRRSRLAPNLLLGEELYGGTQGCEHGAMTSSLGDMSTEKEPVAWQATPTATTLGDVIYASSPDESLPERDWAVLVSYVAAGDQRAFRQLYERTHRLVFSLITRITHSRETADDLTVEVFQDIWKKAATYDAAECSVLGWIMNQARRKALDRLLLEQEPNADVLTPTTPLWGAVAKRIAAESGVFPAFTALQHWDEPQWNEVAPGVSCKLLANDEQRPRVSMLVRLGAGADYPAHTHAGVEELHLLHGELWIDERKLRPGDYHRAEPGTSDERVWSETGCTCVLITSPHDRLT